MFRAWAVALFFIFIIACLFVAPCQNWIPLPMDAIGSAYCRGFGAVPENLPTSLVEVFVLGVFFSTFPALMGIVASRTSASQVGSRHLQGQFETVIDAVTRLLSDENVDRSKEFRRIKNSLKSLLSESNLATTLFPQDKQKLLYKDFQSSFSELGDALPKVNSPEEDLVTYAYESQASFEKCGAKLGELMKNTYFFYFRHARFAKNGRELDDLISKKFSELPQSPSSTEELSHRQMLQALFTHQYSLNSFPAPL